MLDVTALSIQSLRALRGKRSQRGFARLFGYRTNTVYRWESGSRAPLASDVLRVARRIGRDVEEGFAHAERRCAELGVDAADPDFPRRVLVALTGGRTIAAIARSVGLGRLQVSRILRGSARAKWPAFITLLEGLTGRVEAFLEVLVDLEKLPALAERVANREWTAAAYACPWTEAVVATIETTDYARLPRHVDGWIASRLGISVEEERDAVLRLVQAGLLRWSGRKLSGTSTEREVDTRGDEAAFASLKRFWARQSAERLMVEPSGLSGYFVACTSDGSISEIMSRFGASYSDSRDLLRESTGSERVMLLTFCCVPLDGRPIVLDPRREA